MKITEQQDVDDCTSDIAHAQRRSRLLSFLESETPAWQDRNHPELASGSYVWVKALRREWEQRTQKSEE